MAFGDISPVIDNADLGVTGTGVEVFHVTGNIYAMAVYGGLVHTVSIDPAGNIGALIDTYDCPGAGWEVAFTHISGEVFAIAYDNDHYPFIDTIAIDSSGNISLIASIAGVDRGQFEPWNFLHVAGTVYLLVQTSYGGARRFFVSTYNISEDGATLSLIGTVVLAGSLWTNLSVSHAIGDVYALAYSHWDGSSSQRVSTFTVSDAGAITYKDTATLDSPVPNGAPHMVKLVSGILASAYPSDAGNQKIITFPISAAGTIGAIIASLEGTALYTNRLHIYPVGANVYVSALVVPEGGFNKLIVETRVINNDGTIGGALIDTEKITSDFSDNPAILYMGNDLYIIAASVGAPPHLGVNTIGILSLTAPTVATDPAVGIAVVKAVLNGTLNDDGGEACDCGFEWGETMALGNITPTVSRITGQSFSQLIVGLDPDTLYYFRAFATNSSGTSLGVFKTFTTTKSGAATAITLPATGVT